MGYVLRWSLLAAISLILAPTSARTAAGADARQFSAAVRQVEVYASVTGADRHPVRNLTVQDFNVREDDEPQTVTTFAAGEFPAAVALAIDRSFSMAGRPLTTAKTAARVFLGALRAEDRAMLIGIGGQVEVLAPASVDRAAMRHALDAMDAWGTTALHDAIIESVDLLEPESGRRAIVVLSDGEDRYSTARAEDVVARVRRSSVLVYPIAIGPRRPPLFAELAAVSGGMSFHLRDAKALAATLEAIAEDLRWQYLLGYQPARPWNETAEWRSLSVTVPGKGLRVRARSGYTTR
jgi:Ca-activated chloride channel family protein